MKREEVCLDCKGRLILDVEPNLTEIAALCQPCYQTRFEKSKFDEMPVTLNFGRSMKLMIHGRIVRTGVRQYELAQEGLVSFGGRR